MTAIAAPLEFRDRQKAIWASISGNVLEWYDFAVYGYFAPIIAQKFFPSDSPDSSLLAAYGAFAAGFLMRPLGGFLFGYLGDRIGRRRTLILSVALMAVPTFLIGVMPDYSAIGVWAAVLIVVMRMVQGLSVGGEYTTSAIYLVEQAPPGRRGLFASWVNVGCIAGILLGSAVGAFIHTFWEAEVQDWAWRLPFLAGLSVGVLGFVLRRGLPDSTSATELREQAPIARAFRREWRSMLRVCGLWLASAIGFYMMFLYITTYLQREVGLSAALALDINTISMVVLLFTIPVAGYLSDLVGRRIFMIGVPVALLVLSYPLLWVMHHDDPALILSAQIVFALLLGAYGPAISAVMAELFPREVRCSGMSIAYNLTLGLIGGTTPMVATYLIARTHDDLSIAWYLMAAAAISFVSALSIPETAKTPLR
ncbi:MAG: MFS transporter [Alphaproteobacteria bacterium]